MSDAGRTPAISIALCTFNGRHFLAEQLDSLLAQTFRDFEIVAQDDGSTDGTRELLAEYAARDARLRVTLNARTLGLNRNFEAAFRRCRAPTIAPCDQDDRWAPEKLDVLAAALAAQPRAVLAYCDSDLIDAQGRRLGRRVSDSFAMYRGSDPRAFALQNCVSGHACVFRRELLDVALPVPEGSYYDWWLAFWAAALGGITYVNRPLVQFRQHGGSASGFTQTGVRRVRPMAEARHDAQAAPLASLRERAPEPHRAFFEALWRHWRAREGALFSLPLVTFLMRNAGAVYAMRRGPTWLKWRHALKHLPGLPGRSAA